MEIVITLAAISFMLQGSVVKCENVRLIDQNENSFEKERILYGSRMTSYMDFNVDPCEDFYQYACGNFFNVNKESRASGRFGSVYSLHGSVQDKIHEILMKPVNTSQSDPGVDAKARIYYQSCMRANIYPYRKSETFIKLIDSLGGWPILNPNWTEGNFDWFNVTVALKKYRINIIIMEESYFSGMSILGVESFGLRPMNDELHRPYSRNFWVNKKLTKYIMEMYGVPKGEAVKVFNENVKFGKELEELKKKSELNNDDNYYVDIKFQELADFVPELNLTKLYSSVYSEEELQNLTISASEKNTLKQLPDLIRGKNIRRAANYFMLRALFKLHDELEGDQDQKSYCTKKIQRYLKPVVSAMFLESEHHDKNIEDEILAMASYVRSAFKDSIKSATWVDKETRINALKIVQNIGIEIGDLELALELDGLNEKYSGLDITAENGFHQNTLNILKFLSNNKPFDKEPNGIDVNAFYYDEEKKLILPSGIFQRPFYYPELPKPYNFGAIGSILGHEFTHSLDGKQVYEDWWNEEASKVFLERAECFSEQYSSYRIDELNSKLKSEWTMGDDIADNGGIRHSFYGYKKWLSANQGNIDMSKQVLPGLNMTDTQLYFLSFAQLWCESVRGYKAHKSLTRDSHSPGKWRAIGTLSNFDEFSKAFNCKNGSRMNPEKKCLLW